MRKNVQAAVAALMVLGLAGTVQVAGAQEKAASKARTLKVKLNYTGAGTVDAKHRIFMFLFDTPDFSGGNAMPVAFENASAKDATVTFADVPTTAYIVAIFDPKGDYDGMSMPPSGAVIAGSMNPGGAPKPIKIEEGKTLEMALAFDDTNKMP
jgi:hypothetical protein